MHIAVVGAGPAGMTAAYRMKQAGHRVEVLEARPVVGGRTHAARFGAGHHCDTGAGWFTTFYHRALLLLDELDLRDTLVRPRRVRGAADLLVDGALYQGASGEDESAGEKLLDAEDKQRLRAYIAALMHEQAAGLRPDLRYDDHNAEDEFAPLGAAVVDYVLRPLFEGPFFSRLSTMSAAKVRAWLRELQDVTFYQVNGGMDEPWLRIAKQIDVQTRWPVEDVRVVGGGVEITGPTGAMRRYDGVVVAAPAPAAARMLAHATEYVPAWIDEVAYAPEVRVYAARPCADDVAVGMRLVPPDPLFSVEWFSGRHGAWGACPPDWQWALACVYGPASGALLDQPDDALTRDVWERARTVVPELFTLDQAEVVQLIRWEWAIPILQPGHYTRLSQYERRPPIVLAGDWTEQACVEGAVRSGEAAAAAFGSRT
jgi:protoporphyrinogen/coproporphyrinogen III oxidase